MKKYVQWLIVALIWLFAAGCAYVGLIFLMLGPMMGPRGDIDYVAFTEEQQRAADTQAMLTQAFGFIPLAISGVVFFFSLRVAKYVLKFWPGDGAA